MTLTEMIELVKQHHPHMGDTEIRLLLNRASDDFCAKTEIVKESWAITSDSSLSVANQRYYALPTDILRISEVYVNDVKIPRLIGKPIIDDTTSEVDQ